MPSELEHAAAACQGGEAESQVGLEAAEDSGAQEARSVVLDIVGVVLF